jgi:HSP20 family molecular chaperone IbpA
MDDYDEYDDIFDQIKKFFNLDAGIFDMDFFIFPEMDRSPELEKDDRNDLKKKGFKISYHYENGMDKPEMKIEGDIDENEFQKYLKKFNLKKAPQFKIMKRSANNKLMDATHLNLEPQLDDQALSSQDPCSEIYDCSKYTEIIIETPGMEKEDIQITFNPEGNKIKFIARNSYRKYEKEVSLPFKSINKNYELRVNNGIASLVIWRN